MTGTDNPGRRNGKPADVDDRHAMQSYVGHSVAAVRRKLDALGDGTRTRQSDQEALQREADALQTTLDILNAPEDSEMISPSAPSVAGTSLELQ